MPVDYKNWAADATPERVTSPLPFRGCPPLASPEGRYDKHWREGIAMKNQFLFLKENRSGRLSLTRTALVLVIAVLWLAVTTVNATTVTVHVSNFMFTPALV